MLELPPLSLYLHFPWCVRKCPYCDFNSYALREKLPEARYVEALERDLRAQAAWVPGREIVSVFLGGGTPSLFSPATIGRLLATAARQLRFAADVEITLEANPGTIERGRFAEYRAAGINRVSLGAQSFDPVQLGRLGRIHSPDETRRAAEELHAAGLENFNLDLMYGLPDQSVAGALEDLTAALSLEPAHVSHYQLTLEPGTAFAARPPQLPDDEQSLGILAACQEALAGVGFEHYEVSAYARLGRRCRHNLNYWRYGDYLGIGAGAHGKLTHARAGEILRTRAPREPRRYLAAAPEALELHPVPPHERPFEFMLNALRLLEGFALETYEARTGLGADTVLGRLRALAARDLLRHSGTHWRMSELGLRFLNDVLLEFLPEQAVGELPLRPTAGHAR